VRLDVELREGVAVGVAVSDAKTDGVRVLDIVFPVFVPPCAYDASRREPLRLIVHDAVWLILNVSDFVTLAVTEAVTVRVPVPPCPREAEGRETLSVMVTDAVWLLERVGEGVPPWP